MKLLAYIFMVNLLLVGLKLNFGTRINIHFTLVT